MSDTNTQRLSPLEKFSYGLGDTASNIVFQMVVMFMPLFYTDVFAIPSAAMGTLFLVVRFLDAIADPLMGAICDRTDTRWGKFRPYLIWFCVPFAFLGVLSFTTPPFGEGGRLVYAYITYSLLMGVYTAINIPYCALGGVITDDSSQRVSLNSYRFALVSVAAILVASATLPLVQFLGNGNDRLGFSLTMVVYGILAIVFFVLCFLLTRERVQEQPVHDTNLWHDLALLWQNDQWRIVAAANLILLIALVMRGGAAAYYINWFTDHEWLGGKKTSLTILHTTAAIAMIFGAPFATVITRRLANSRAYALIHGGIAIISIAMYVIPSSGILMAIVGYASIAFFTQMANPILWAMLADTVDYGEQQSGRRITGLAFAGALFALKVGMAIGGALLGWLLSAYGYVGTSNSQSSGALNGIVLAFTIIPGVFHILLAMTVVKYGNRPV